MVIVCLLIVWGCVDVNLFHLQGKAECWLQCAKIDDPLKLSPIIKDLHHGLIREGYLK